jgi:hypothetical protein
MTIKSQTLISDTNVKLIELISTIYNVMLLAFYRAIDQSKTIFNLVNGFMDEYEDESGIDTANSSNEIYNSTDDYYSPTTTTIDSYTKLLLHLNNNVTDSEITPKTVTNNNVTFSDTIKKFGTHSASFNGSNAYLTVPDSTDWDFGTGDFTIDCWVVFNTVSSTQYIWSQGTSGSINVGFAWRSDSKWQFFIYNGTAKVNFTGDDSITTGVWYHVVIVRYGNVWTIYRDGVAKGSQTVSESYLDFTGNFVIGAWDYNEGRQNYLNGYIDEFRVSKGIARWTSNFTPPTSEYPFGAENMTLLSNAQVATNVPSSARIVLFEEDVDLITPNTDLKAYISRDNGTTYSEVTLTNEGYYATSKNILAGFVDVSGQPSGDDIKYKIETLNNKNLKLHGVGINWA